MATTQANGITLEYETFGDGSDRPLLLIMGFGAQMTRWHPHLCQLLVDQGHYVIRFDNRDVGLSEKFVDAGAPDLMAVMSQALAGETVTAPYTLSDMANDAAGLLDALKLESAHVCGASMGGMIGQVMALEHGARVRSLTSIMSTTGDPSLPPATEAALMALLSPASDVLEENLARAVRVARAIGSPAYPAAEADIRARAQVDFERCFYPDGVRRQMAAIAATGNRRPALERLEKPTLVLHGRDDPLVPLTGGLDTHAAIKGSVMKIFDGMGHDLPEPLWPAIAGEIAAHTRQHN